MPKLRCDFPANPEAEKLVADYLHAVIRASNFWQPIYPHDDIEHMFVFALYRAAWTWKPERESFYRWWFRKASGAMGRIRKRDARYARGLKWGNGPNGRR